MWLRWLSSPRGDRTTVPPPTRTRSCGSSRFSFKDIHTLLQSEVEPESPKSPSLLRRLSLSSRTIPTSISLPEKFDHGSIVLYYTSLRVIRRTFNDCRTVRSILRRFAVAIDERDVCVDERFREELLEILGRRNVSLPCVFIGGEYIGGIDDIRKLYDHGELQEMIERLPKSLPKACDFCGGQRFLVCDQCDGSRKVFAETNGFKTCLSCNTNGLIRCPACFFKLLRHTK